MAARKRASSNAKPKPQSTTETIHNISKSQQITPISTTNSPIAPSKAAQILAFSLLFFVPYFFLICYHYRIEPDLKRSILINALLSAVGFILTLAMIPVASRYVLRRNMFGYDINKKGTPQGSIKVWVFFFFFSNLVRDWIVNLKHVIFLFIFLLCYWIVIT